MLRALGPLALGTSLVLSACTVHIHPAATPSAQEGAQPAPKEEEQRDTIVLVHPEPRAPEPAPQPIEPRRRVAPDSQPQPQQGPERRQPIVPQLPVEPEAAQFAWACPSGEDPRWVRVPLHDADAHRQRGDSVTTEPQADGTPCVRAEAPPPPTEQPTDPRQQRDPRPPAPLRPQQQAVWVCHGETDPRWLRVAAAAAEAHRQHGDPVSTVPQQAGAPCVRGEEQPPQPPDQPQQPPRRDQREPLPPPPTPAVAWVCHGTQDPRWLEVPRAAVEGHQQHGDTVSYEPREAGAPCTGGEEQPHPEEPKRPPQPEQPRAGQFAWVCHGEESPSWLRVALPAVEAHRQHGDPVSLEPREAGTPCKRTEEEPPPEEPVEPEQPEQPQPQQFAWVCHGEQNPRWLRVAMPAVEAHREHGDPASTEPREAGTPCERTPEEPPSEEPPPPEQPPPQPQPEFLWVCHGTRNPTWQRVAASAAEAHRQHGDPVSTVPQQQGARCER